MLAMSSALGEAAELHAAEHPDFSRFRFQKENGVFRPFVEAQTLLGKAASVPAEAVWCPPIDRGWASPHVEQWTSNGLASHSSQAAATCHAVCELLERDAVARALPHGWTPSAVKRYHVDVPTRWRWLLEKQVEVVLLALPALAPTAAALLVDTQDNVNTVTAGYATRLEGRSAIDAAVLEAAQSRLTDIHGAREDIGLGRESSTDNARLLLGACLGRSERAFESAKVSFQTLRQRLGDSVSVVDLTTAPVTVVKAWAPRLRRSELL